MLDQVAEHVIKMRHVKAHDTTSGNSWLSFPQFHSSLYYYLDYLARVEITDSDFSTYITFHDEDKVNPPFRIENDTPLTLFFAQRTKDKEKYSGDDFTGNLLFKIELCRPLNSVQLDKAPPRTTVDFGLDEPTATTRVIACFENDFVATKSYNMSKIKAFKPVSMRVPLVYLDFRWLF